MLQTTESVLPEDDIGGAIRGRAFAAVQRHADQEVSKAVPIHIARARDRSVPPRQRCSRSESDPADAGCDVGKLYSCGIRLTEHEICGAIGVIAVVLLKGADEEIGAAVAIDVADP